MMKKNKYTFGRCKNCGKEVPLKNGYCVSCQDKNVDLPPGFEELFGDLIKNEQEMAGE